MGREGGEIQSRTHSKHNLSNKHYLTQYMKQNIVTLEWSRMAESNCWVEWLPPKYVSHNFSPSHSPSKLNSKDHFSPLLITRSDLTSVIHALVTPRLDYYHGHLLNLAYRVGSAGGCNNLTHQPDPTAHPGIASMPWETQIAESFQNEPQSRKQCVLRCWKHGFCFPNSPTYFSQLLFKSCLQGL